MRLSHVIPLLPLIVVSAVGGCTGAYDVAVLNMTDHDMDDVRTHLGKEIATQGFVAAGTYHSWGLLPHPIPPKAVIAWRDGDRDRYRTVDIPESLRRFNGYIFFRFMPGGRIDLVPIPRSGRGSSANPETARAVSWSEP